MKNESDGLRKINKSSFFNSEIKKPIGDFSIFSCRFLKLMHYFLNYFMDTFNH